MGAGELAIIMVFAIPLAAVIGGLAVEALKVLRRGSDKETQQRLKEETELVQDLHGRLERMEDRIETLESILIEHEREREFAELRRSESHAGGREEPR